MRGGGHGVGGNIVLRTIGTLIGGFIVGLLLPGTSAGLIGSIVLPSLARSS